jgi:hypothetical protein
MSGQIEREITYKNDKLHGPYKEYYENGQICKDTTYLNGICIKDNGKVLDRIKLSNLRKEERFKKQMDPDRHDTARLILELRHGNDYAKLKKQGNHANAYNAVKNALIARNSVKSK